MSNEAEVGPDYIEDIDEARATAFGEKPLRDDMAENKDGTEAERAYLHKRADTRGDRARQEYLEQREALPSKVIERVGTEFSKKLEEPKFDKDRHFADRLPRRFAKVLEKAKAEKKEHERRYEKRYDIRPRDAYLRVSPPDTPLHLDGLDSKAHNSQLSEDAEDALYEVLGVGAGRVDVIEAFQRLTEEQKTELGKLTGDTIGDMSKDGYSIYLPTRIEGIILHLNKHHTEKDPAITLIFTPEFLKKALQEKSPSQ